MLKNYVFILCFTICCVLFGKTTFASDGENMSRIELTEQTMQRLLSTHNSANLMEDPDIIEMRDRLMFGEIYQRGVLDDKTRSLINLVVLTTIQTPEQLSLYTEIALASGASAVEIKEALYMCAPYIGFPRTEQALNIVNNVFQEKNIALPVQSQKTVTEENRFEKGLAVQKQIFGNAIDNMHANSPENQIHLMKDYLSAFCFGDIYTRTGLSLPIRELLTFTILSSLGGSESQVTSHVVGNLAVGNNKDMLVDALTQSLPFIGFPRTLNALACVNSVK